MSVADSGRLVAVVATRVFVGGAGVYVNVGAKVGTPEVLVEVAMTACAGRVGGFSRLRSVWGFTPTSAK